jgi:hypothetical protein
MTQSGFLLVGLQIESRMGERTIEYVQGWPLVGAIALTAKTYTVPTRIIVTGKNNFLTIVTRCFMVPAPRIELGTF